jgi:hypothetical protein
VGAVNNNDQLTAVLSGNDVFFHEGASIVSTVPGTDITTFLSSLNDFTMQNSQGTAKVALVGYYFPSGGQGHGFLATSQ